MTTQEIIETSGYGFLHYQVICYLKRPDRFAVQKKVSSLSPDPPNQKPLPETLGYCSSRVYYGHLSLFKMVMYDLSVNAVLNFDDK